METKLCFSFISGQIFHLQEDEIKNLGNECVVLKKKPSGSCKKCYGRLYVGKHKQFKDDAKIADYFVPCLPCLRKCIDTSYVTERTGEL